jgi:prenyl protein peptidase
MELNNKINFENINIAKSILLCFLMASFYVISLYLWSKQNRFNRNDPSVIKRRFISVSISYILSLLTLYLIAQQKSENQNPNFFYLHEWIGLRLEFLNCLKSIVVSIILTITLFLGPILQNIISNFLFECEIKNFEEKRINNNTRNNNENQSIVFFFFFHYIIKQTVRFFSLSSVLRMKHKMKNLTFLRNYIISPFTEEFVFRSCMLPLLIHNLNSVTTIMVTPLFFGLAHLHHIIEGFMHHESPVSSLIFQHLFQFCYTYLFGVYSSFLFLKTGNFFASFLCHSFCNFMGFPNFVELIEDFKGKSKLLIIIFYLSGFIGFVSFFFFFPKPEFFGNKIYKF